MEKEREKQWLSPAEVAAEFGVTAETVRRIIRRGDAPAKYLGRLIRIDRRDIEKVLQSANPNAHYRRTRKSQTEAV